MKRRRIRRVRRSRREGTWRIGWQEKEEKKGEFGGYGDDYYAYGDDTKEQGQGAE
jgi:hypothetical protein